MKSKLITAALAVALGAALPSSAFAQIPGSITTPDTVETSIGKLQYKDGAPSKETVAKVYDYLDLMHGVEAFVNLVVFRVDGRQTGSCTSDELRPSIEFRNSLRCVRERTQQ